MGKFVMGFWVLCMNLQAAWANEGAVAPATAAATGATPGQPPQPGIGSMLVPFALMFGVVYFLMIRPQQKKMKEQQDMLSKLKNGDEIVTASGLLGKVSDVSEKIVTVELASDVRVRMLKSQVSQVLKPGQVPGAQVS